MWIKEFGEWVDSPSETKCTKFIKVSLGMPVVCLMIVGLLIVAVLGEIIAGVENDKIH